MCGDTARRCGRAVAALGATSGQAMVLVVGGLFGIVVGALVLGAVAQLVGREGKAQRAADLAALAGARAMQASQWRLFEPAFVAGEANPERIEKAAYLALGRTAAERVARENDAGSAAVSFPDGDEMVPARVRVTIRERFEVGEEASNVDAVAEAELSASVDPLMATGGGYDGPLAYRQGKPMRPDVAQAFDRMERSARADGVALLVNSGFRSDAEQAVLFARHPDPKWVARPGTSLHRNGTELDLGPPAAYRWLAANARRFGFIQRYSWEPWHYGYTLNPRSSPRASSSAGARAETTGRDPAAGDEGGSGNARDDDVVERGSGASDGVRSSTIPSFVPAQYAPFIARASQRWNVSSTLLAAQLYAESGFDPNARSGAGAQGIAQFMPGTARAMGLANPFDAEQAIDAQAHLMRDLLRQFGSVPLALAAYNAGPGRVAACGCIPPFPETRAYVAKILGLMGGAGDLAGTAGPVVRLVR